MKGMSLKTISDSKKSDLDLEKGFLKLKYSVWKVFRLLETKFVAWRKFQTLGNVIRTLKKNFRLIKAKFTSWKRFQALMTAIL